MIFNFVYIVEAGGRGKGVGRGYEPPIGGEPEAGSQEEKSEVGR